MTDSDPRALLIRFRRRGDPDDFAAFYDATVAGLLPRARRLAPDDDGADELVQATYVAAMTSVERFDRRRDAMAWLFGILHNQARVMRWRHRRRPDAERLAWPEPGDPAELAEDRELHERVDCAIAELSPVYQPVVILHLQHGLSAREIGAALGRPAGTVRTQLVRGLARLRAALPVSLASALLVQITPAARARGGDALREALRERAAEAAAAPVNAAGATAAASVALSSTALASAGLAAVTTAALLLWVPVGGAADAAPVARARVASADVAGGAGAGPKTAAPLAARTPVETSPERAASPDPQDPQRGALPSYEELFAQEGRVPGAGGAYGGRFAGRERLGTRGFPAGAEAIGKALDWLAAHQSPDGRWDADGFMALDDPKLGPATDGLGAASEDVLATALAALTFLHDGKHGQGTDYAGVVPRAVYWLLRQQNGSTGALAPTGSALGVLHHAIATLAVVECYGLTANDKLEPFARRAVWHLEELTGGEGYWILYEAGEDRSAELTAWAVHALHAARSFGMEPPAYPALAQALDTLPAETARARAGRLVAHFFGGAHGGRLVPVDAEALMGFDADLRAPDYETWFLLARGTYQVGGRTWKRTSELMPALVELQRHDGNFAGSWDPNVARTRGGRVAATALAALGLETYYAHARLRVR